jgi:hypothetical protein
MRISLNGSGELAVKPSIEGVAAQLDAAVDAGFGGYWLAQTGLADALTVLVAAAGDRVGLEVGTAVVPTFPAIPPCSLLRRSPPRRR